MNRKAGPIDKRARARAPLPPELQQPPPDPDAEPHDEVAELQDQILELQCKVETLTEELENTQQQLSEATDGEAEELKAAKAERETAEEDCADIADLVVELAGGRAECIGWNVEDAKAWLRRQIDARARGTFGLVRPTEPPPPPPRAAERKATMSLRALSVHADIAEDFLSGRKFPIRHEELRKRCQVEFRSWDPPAFLMQAMGYELRPDATGEVTWMDPADVRKLKPYTIALHASQKTSEGRSGHALAGKIVALVDIVAVEQAQDYADFDGTAFCIANVRPVPQVPCKGQVGFWRVPEGLVSPCAKS